MISSDKIKLTFIFDKLYVDYKYDWTLINHQNYGKYSKYNIECFTRLALANEQTKIVYLPFFKKYNDHLFLLQVKADARRNPSYS